jgi:hypothetical protein
MSVFVRESNVKTKKVKGRKEELRSAKKISEKERKKCFYEKKAGEKNIEDVECEEKKDAWLLLRRKK